MHKRNFMIFGTNKLHKATNGMLPILCLWMGNTLGGATCILACTSHTGSEFSEKVVRTTFDQFADNEVELRRVGGVYAPVVSRDRVSNFLRQS